MRHFRAIAADELKGDMSNIDENSRIVRNDSIPTGVIDGEMVALDLDKGDCFGMDRIGTRIWELAEAPKPVSAIIDQLASEHEVDRATCSTDVIAFVADLARSGLVRVLDE
jgi:hypothetical protein